MPLPLQPPLLPLLRAMVLFWNSACSTAATAAAQCLLAGACCLLPVVEFANSCCCVCCAGHGWLHRGGQPGDQGPGAGHQVRLLGIDLSL